VLGNVGELDLPVSRGKSGVVFRVDLCVVLGRRDQLMVGKEEAVTDVGADAVRYRPIPEVAANRRIGGVLVIEFFQRRDRLRHDADSDNDTALSLHKRDVPGIEENEGFVRLESAEKCLKAVGLILRTKHPGAFKAGGLLWRFAI
jgi:hypothetical protein